MKTFTVNYDIKASGSVDIDAETIEDAKEIWFKVGVRKLVAGIIEPVMANIVGVSEPPSL